MRANTAVWVLGGLAVTLLAVAVGIWFILDQPSSAGPNDLPEQLAANDADPDNPSAEDSIVTAEKIQSMQRTLQPDGILDMCIKRYHLRLGRYPTSLEDLLTEPEHLRSGERWDGPYIHNARFLIDPWNRRYEFASPGKHNPDSYDIWSRGQDGISGTEDDVGNW